MKTFIIYAIYFVFISITACKDKDKTPSIPKRQVIGDTLSLLQLSKSNVNVKIDTLNSVIDFDPHFQFFEDTYQNASAYRFKNQIYTLPNLIESQLATFYAIRAHHKSYLMIQMPIHHPNDVMYRHLQTHIFRLNQDESVQFLRFESFICSPLLLMDGDKDGEIEMVVNKPSSKPVEKERWYDYYDFSIVESTPNGFQPFQVANQQPYLLGEYVADGSERIIVHRYKNWTF